MQFLSTTLAISFAPEIAERTLRLGLSFLIFPGVGLEGGGTLYIVNLQSEAPFASNIQPTLKREKPSELFSFSIGYEFEPD